LKNMHDQATSNSRPSELLAAYESPSLRILGNVAELTQSCFGDKSLGTPDYLFHIPVPIQNCSA